MAYTKINISLAAKKQHVVIPRFARTAEWEMMKTDLDKGLRRQEVLQLSLSDEDKVKYGLKSRRTIARFIRKYLRSKNLSYVVKSFRRDSKDYVLVQAPSKQR
jgi:hypothetical protein